MFTRKRVDPEVLPAAAVLSTEDMACLVALMDAAIDRRVADAVVSVKAEVLGALPKWLRDAKPFPMNADDMGRHFAEEHKDEYRFGGDIDDPTPRWFWRRGPTWQRPWVPMDMRSCRDAFRDMRRKLAERAHEDCIQSEAERRLHFIEKTCQSAAFYDQVLAVAGEILGPPQQGESLRLPEQTEVQT